MAFTVTDQGSATGVSGGTLAMTVSGTIAVGSLVVVTVMENNTTGVIGSLADSAGNTYTPADDVSPNSASGNGRAGLWYCLRTTAVLTGGSGTITYTRNTSATATCIAAISATYVGSAVLDQHPTPTTGTGTINLSIAATGSGGTELYVAAVGTKGGGATNYNQAATWTDGPDYQNATGGIVASGGGFKLASGAQTYAPTLTASRPWAMFMVVLQEQATFSDITFQHLRRPTRRHPGPGDDGIAAPFVPTRLTAIDARDAPVRARQRRMAQGGDDGLPRFQQWLASGWAGPHPQPNHPRPERAAAVLAGWEPSATYQQWRNAGWEVQAVQPNHPATERRGAALRVDDGTQGPFARWLNSGWEVQAAQPPHPRRERSGAWLRSDDGSSAAFILWRNGGWEVQPWQPPHRRSERAGGVMRGDDGTEAVFSFAISTASWGWQLEPAIAPHPRRERLATAVKGADGADLPFSLWRNAGWESRPPDLRLHRRTGWFAPEGVIVRPVTPITVAWDSLPHVARARRRVEAAGPWWVSTFQAWVNAGWEAAPPPPRRPAPRAGAWLRGDDGDEAAFVFWLPYGWEVRPPQPPHPPQRGAVLHDVEMFLPLVPPPIPPLPALRCIIYGRAQLPKVQGRAICGGDSCGCQ